VNATGESGAGTGLCPAFRDARDGETHLARQENGALADQHLFHHLPERWVVERDTAGRALALHPAIVAGYRRGAEFHPAHPGASARPLDA